MHSSSVTPAYSGNSLASSSQRQPSPCLPILTSAKRHGTMRIASAPVSYSSTWKSSVTYDSSIRRFTVKPTMVSKLCHLPLSARCLASLTLRRATTRTSCWVTKAIGGQSSATSQICTSISAMTGKFRAVSSARTISAWETT